MADSPLIVLIELISCPNILVLSTPISSKSYENFSLGPKAEPRKLREFVNLLYLFELILS